MKVMITGGTGFIGYHSALALLDAGYEICLLVRSEDKMRRLFGARTPDFVVGDVTDEASVREALQGCDALIHTAAMVSTDRRDAQRVHATNVGGTRLVIGSAVALDLKCIIHVSSVTALFDPDADVLNEFSPPGTAQNAYGKSKVECEIYARRLQDQGAPIHITYPGSVIGPEDPALTEPHQGLKTYLKGINPVMSGGNQWVDVRDIAGAHLTLLGSDLPPGRYTLGGHYVSWAGLVDLLSELTGRPMTKIPLPGSLMRGLGRVMDVINRIRTTPIELPVSHEAMVYATRWVSMDDGRAERELGLVFRPLEESLQDAIRSLVIAGEVTPEQAGDILKA